MTSPQASTASTPTTSSSTLTSPKHSSLTDTTTSSTTISSAAADDVINTPLLAGIKKRGRPPKKAYIAEMEAENARKIQSEIDNTMTKKPLEEEEDVVKPLENIAVEPATVPNITHPIIAVPVKNNENIDDSSKESETNHPRKRGRPKKTIIDIESNA